MDPTQVIDAAHVRSPKQLITTMDLLLVHEQPVLQGAHPALKFSDYLVLDVARKAGHSPHATFHKSLARVTEAQELQVPVI